MQKLDYAQIGARIRQIRKEKGWSQDELAKKCDVSMNYIGHIERGTRKMSLDTFTNLCRELEADADVLLWGTEQPSESIIKQMWKEPQNRDSDSYSMYVRIMKSVADIMGSNDNSSQI